MDMSVNCKKDVNTLNQKCLHVSIYCFIDFNGVYCLMLAANPCRFAANRAMKSLDLNTNLKVYMSYYEPPKVLMVLLYCQLKIIFFLASEDFRSKCTKKT